MGSNVQYRISHGETSSTNSSPLSGQYYAIGGTEIVVDQFFAAGGSLQLVSASWSAPGGSSGDLVAVELYANQSCTIQTNGNGTIGVQTITIGGTPTGGTFALAFNGIITAPIAYNAAASAVQSALNTALGASSVTCTGGPLPGTAVTVTFGSAYTSKTVPLLTSNIGGLTGGSPTIAIANASGTPQDVIQLTAGVPVLWDTQQIFACPFLGAVSSLYVTNTNSCRLQGRVLTL
jgi:hypothetical protein